MSCFLEDLLQEVTHSSLEKYNLQGARMKKMGRKPAPCVVQLPPPGGPGPHGDFKGDLTFQTPGAVEHKGKRAK